MNGIQDKIIAILSRDYSPSGNEQSAETIDKQLDDEKELEEIFQAVLKEHGPAHVVTIEIFFKLFDVLIGLYRLEKCQRYLEVIHAACMHDDSPREIKIRWLQASAFTKWKQGHLEEAASAFEEIEALTAGTPSPALLENMAHTFSSLGEYEKAEKYFNEAIKISGSENGGLALGLGILYERTGQLDRGIETTTQALKWYRSRFSDMSNESSLEAKCQTTLARMLHNKGDDRLAHAYIIDAIDIFTRTCGPQSPLVAGALKIQGDIQAGMEDWENAVRSWNGSLEIEQFKDEPDLVNIIELFKLISTTVERVKEPSARRALYEMATSTSEAVCESLVCDGRTNDGNTAAVIKTGAELAIYASHLEVARRLLLKAIPIFETDPKLECTVLLDQCREYIHLIDQSTKT